MARQPIEVFFATNRNLVGTEAKPKFGEGFHTLGPYYIRYGRGMVVPPAENGGEYKVRSVKLAKEKIPKRRGATPTLGSDEIFESIRSQMSAGDMDTVILIHGFASTFNTALKRGPGARVGNVGRCHVDRRAFRRCPHGGRRVLVRLGIRLRLSRVHRASARVPLGLTEDPRRRLGGVLGRLGSDGHAAALAPRWQPGRRSVLRAGVYGGRCRARR